MAEKLRIRCPFCGMHPTLEVLDQTVKEKPAEVRIFLQKYGGKLPAPVEGKAVYEKKGRGSAPGYMEWVEITGQVPEQVAAMEELFRARVKLFLQKVGED